MASLAKNVPFSCQENYWCGIYQMPFVPLGIRKHGRRLHATEEFSSGTEGNQPPPTQSWHCTTQPMCAWLLLSFASMHPHAAKSAKAHDLTEHTSYSTCHTVVHANHRFLASIIVMLSCNAHGGRRGGWPHRCVFEY